MGRVSESLADIRHLVVVDATRVAAGDRPGIARDATECRAFHLPPEGEDRAALWREYAAALEAAGYVVADDEDAAQLADDIAAGSLPDVTVTEADGPALDAVIIALDRSPDLAATTLVAVMLGGGDALPVVVPEGALGTAGTLLLLSPWTPAGWESEEVLDHTSLLRFCERWTAARGREVPAGIPAWRRALCGDLLRVIELRDPADVGPLPEVAGRRLARPVPYFPVADLRIGDNGVTLRLGNVGPVAAASAPFSVDDGTAVAHVVAPPSPLDDQLYLRIPVAIVDGRYDVTVLGPDHFRRRFAGSFPDADVHCEVEQIGRDPWFPELTLTVWHDLTLPTFFWLERRLGERAASKAAGYGSGTFERLPGPRQTARFKEEPGANTFGWYDVAVTTSADEAWVREYAGHMPTGARPTLGY